MPSGQSKQSALCKDTLQQGQPSLTLMDVTEEARVLYSRLNVFGLPDSVTFDAFLSVYTLGSGYTEAGNKENMQTDVYASRAGVKKNNTGTDVKEQKIAHTKLVPSKSHLRTDKENGKGKWKEALDIIGQTLVGRTEAARVRASISAARSNGEVLFEDPMKIADDRRESLYRMLGSVQKEWDIESRQLLDLDRRKKGLEREIEHKRKDILLLNILEKREGIRMKRIGSVGNGEQNIGDGKAGIGDLMKRLRTETTSNSQTFQDKLNSIQRVTPESDAVLSPSTLQKLQRRPNLGYKHSANTLANLHSYHVHLAHMKARAKTVRNGSAEEDLNERIENSLKALGVRDVPDTKRKLEAVARLRAERRRKFNVGSLNSSVSKIGLEELQQTNERSKTEVQQHLNNAIALGWVCEGYVDLIATFREQTAPALDDSMAEEQGRIEGYVDKMKIAILRQPQKVNGSFSQRVREVLGTNRVRVWQEVDETLKYSSPKVDIMDVGPDRDLVIENLDVSDVSRILERKKLKAEHGYTMAEEIRGLVQGCKKLKYV